MILTTERLVLREFEESDWAPVLAYQIWSWCIADNLASVRVLERLGMRREGRLRENEFFQGRWWDTLLYGILDHEWRAGQ
jgi:RimJ/RimL family protein N-acetyltransferase